MAGLIAVHAHAGEQDLPTQIMALQKERVAVLTTLVEICTAQFMVGTILNESLVSAETDLVNAQMAATAKPEEQIALLTAALKRERDILKKVEYVCGPEFSQADIERWRSISLYTQIRLARAQKNEAAPIKALEKERIAALTKLVEIRESEYRVGTIWCEAVVSAEVALLNAQADAADKPEERVALLTEGVKRESALLKIVKVRFQAGTVSQADVYRARSLLLATKIRLLRERSRQKGDAAQIKALQRDRVGALTALVKLDEGMYTAAQIDCETAIGAEADLVDAQMDATGESESRVSVLTETVKKGTDFLKIVEARFQAGTVSQTDVCRARAYLLATKIRLSQERGTRKAATK